MNRDKKQWLRFLQTIFQIVIDEQRAYVSKSTAPALKRLKDAAQAVRMIIERAAADIPRKAFKAVFSHILSIIVVQAKLFEPIALEYLKALRACVAFPPHLDHLDVKLWNHAVSTCFSAVLGDTIKGYELVDDHAMDVDDDDEDRSSNATQRSKKRKVNGTFRLAPTDSENFSFSQTGYTYSASQNTIELCSCIEAFFKSSQAPLVSKGGVLLSKFTRFFRSFPHETTAHQSMLAALNRLLNDLEFNNKSLLEKAVSHLWPPMVALWNTKSNALKEQLVMATTLLLPYTFLLEGCSLANSLYNATLTEIENRWGAEPLDLDSLALNCSAPGQDNLPHHGFSTRLFHAGSTFDFQQVLSWTILNLSAACFIPCDKFTSEISTGSSISSPAPKRARVSQWSAMPSCLNLTLASQVDRSIDIFQQLLSDLKNQNERGIQHRLQLVIFICELDSRAVTASRMQLLQASVVALLSHSSGTIQTWAMICLASLATSQSLLAQYQRKAPVYDRDCWSMVWERCLKAFHQPSTSRAACFLLLTISSLHMIDEGTRTTDLIAIGTDIEIQGPPYPTDAACALLLQIVKIAESDVRTYRLDLANKICNRITNNWQWRPAMIRPSRLFNPKGRTEPLSPMSYFDLLIAISYGSSQASQTARQDTVLADSALTNFWNTRDASRSMRAWFWDASLLESVEGKLSEAEEAVLDSTEATTNPVALKILAHLRKGLEGLADELEDADDLYWQGLNLESFRNMLDFAWISIAFDAYADLRQVIRSERISAQSLRLLDALMPKIQHSKWSLPEKAALLTALSPMFFQIQDAPIQSEVLICAGLSSGVRISSITSGEGRWLASRQASS